MKTFTLRSFLIGCCALLVGIFGCAGKPKVLNVPPGPGEKTVAIKADSFHFEPDVIKAHQGDVLILQVENLADSEHNLTIRNPRGEIVQSMALPAKKTVDTVVELGQGGTFEFFCDKPFHSTFGMKGRIEAEPEP